jgi:hypothetical protein
MLRPQSTTGLKNWPPDQARQALDRLESIPRISHDQRQTAAPGGIWLHGLETSQGRQGAPELVCLLVAGVGFEPT